MLLISLGASSPWFGVPVLRGGILLSTPIKNKHNKLSIHAYTFRGGSWGQGGRHSNAKLGILGQISFLRPTELRIISHEVGRRFSNNSSRYNDSAFTSPD